ncbi:MAG: HEAT repeat domain-containing protein [Verrucomicrobiota bacterium]
MFRRYFLWIVVLSVCVTGCSTKEDRVIDQVESLIESSQFNQALEMLQQALRENPSNKKLLRQKILLLLKSGQVDFAVATYKKLAEVSPNDSVLKNALKDKNTVVKVAAIKALGLLKDASAAERLISVAKDSDQNVRKAVIVALGDMKNEKAIPLLIQYLKDKDWFIRAEAANALGKVGNSAAADALFKLLEDSDQYVRRNARQALQNLTTKENKSVYVKALENPDASIKIMAALALAHTEDRAGVPILLSEFEKAGSDDQVEMIKAFIKLREAEAVPKIRVAMSHSKTAVRVHAILALGWFKDTESAALLRQISQDKSESGEIRLASLRALELLERKE